MADIADRAQELTEQSLEDALAARRRYRGVSAHFCIECDDVIPEPRRLALPGVQRCRECQAEIEARGDA